MFKLLKDPLTGHLVYALLYIFIIVSIATCGYTLNGWSISDSFYMTILTIFSVGYEEVRPIDTDVLRSLTSLLIIFGCTGMIYLTGALVQFITFGQLQTFLGTKRMNKQIHDMEGHTIICGYGRLGSMLARLLGERKSDVVIIEPDHNRYVQAKASGYPAINSDAIDENALIQAGILRARALTSVVSSDPINVFITLSARGLNRTLQIIARAEDPATETKLLQAGANAVILPTHIGAEQIASLIMFSPATGLIHSSERRRQLEVDLRAIGLQISVLVMTNSSQLAGRSIEEIEKRSGGNFFIIGVERQGIDPVGSTSRETLIYPGDGVTVLGRIGRTEELNKF
jgi:voltage-gated potassium channel